MSVKHFTGRAFTLPARPDVFRQPAWQRLSQSFGRFCQKQLKQVVLPFGTSGKQTESWGTFSTVLTFMDVRESPVAPQLVAPRSNASSNPGAPPSFVATVKDSLKRFGRVICTTLQAQLLGAHPWHLRQSSLKSTTTSPWSH